MASMQLKNRHNLKTLFILPNHPKGGFFRLLNSTKQLYKKVTMKIVSFNFPNSLVIQNCSIVPLLDDAVDVLQKTSSILNIKVWF
jgi:hypothetical protein